MASDERLFCLYCFTRENLSDSHLFPRSIGGTICERISCSSCNSQFGHAVEGDIKKTLFFAEGIAQCVGKSREEAYRDILIEDADTGKRLKYKGDDLIYTAGRLDDGTLTGPIEDIRRRTRKDLSKQMPHWVEYYDKEVQNGKKRIRIADREYEIKRVDSTGPVKYMGKGAFPWALLAKVAYEGAYLFQQFTRSVLRDFYSSTFRVYQTAQGKTTRIDIDPHFKSRVLSRGSPLCQ